MVWHIFSHQRSHFWIEIGIMELNLHILLLRCLGLQRSTIRSQTYPCSIQWQGQRICRWRMWPGRNQSPSRESITGLAAIYRATRCLHQSWEQKLQQSERSSESGDLYRQSQSGAIHLHPVSSEVVRNTIQEFGKTEVFQFLRQYVHSLLMLSIASHLRLCILSSWYFFGSGRV